MNYLDIVIAIPLLWGAFRGFKNGLLVEVGGIAAIALGIWGGIKFSKYLADVFSKNFDFNHEWMQFFTFALIFIAVLILSHIITKLLTKLLTTMALGVFLKIGGIVFGIFKYAVIVGFVLILLDTLNARFNFLDPVLINKSLLFSPILDLAKQIRLFFGF